MVDTINKKALKSVIGTPHDYEFYPTSYEMLEVVYKAGLIEGRSVLDIGAGSCNFKNYFDKYEQKNALNHDLSEARKEKLANAKGDKYWKREYERRYINQYFAIEKSKPLIDLFDKETICLGTDFWAESLIDKPVDIIFCNPPYSEYESWCEKIISQGNCSVIYLVIPQRWKNSEKINNAIERKRFNVNVLGSFDFLEADRVARAKVDIVEIKKPYYNYATQKPQAINEDAFDRFFDEAFAFNSEVETEKEESERIANQLISSNANRAKVLVELYEQEKLQLQNDISSICKMRPSILKTLGISKESVKLALKQKLKGLKILYWERAFNELEEITSRLTYKTRSKMLENFSSIKTVEFTYDNIYPLVAWVIKNSNEYYNSQLIEFYKSITSFDHIKLYKSNQKTFAKENWRFKQEATHYTLDYRIVCSGIFKTTYFNKLDLFENPKVIDDICTIANNLSFLVQDKKERTFPEETGVKYFIYLKDGSVLMEYKLYQNGNTHIKLNIEFAKALNVEAARLLGWIRGKEDIVKEFTPEMAKGAEKYFKVNEYATLNNNSNQLLLAAP